VHTGAGSVSDILFPVTMFSPTVLSSILARQPSASVSRGLFRDGLKTKVSFLSEVNCKAKLLL